MLYYIISYSKFAFFIGVDTWSCVMH